MRGTWESDPTGKRAAVVFVHGILSSAEKGWTNDAGKTWPRLLEESLRGESIAVYSFTYRTSFGSGDFSINDAADNMNELLVLDKVSQFPTIVFVCHSMGGLVVRRFLVQRQQEYAASTFGIFLVASPSMGAKYANWLAPIIGLAGHAQADALKVIKANPWLSTLDSDFSRLIRNKDIKGREIVEDLPLFAPGWLFKKPLVDSWSGARFFAEPLRIPATNHFTIAKPESKDALQQRMLREFVLEVCTRESGAGPQPGPVDAARFLLQSSHAEKIALVGRIPYGPAVASATIHPEISRAYTAALDIGSALALADSASNIVLAADPGFQARPELISVTRAELPQGASSRDVVWSLFQLSALKGPRMLAALLLCAPQQAVFSVGEEIVKLLRSLRVEV